MASPDAAATPAIPNKAQTESPLTWYHALPILTLLLVGSASLALHRLRRAEVFG